MNDKGPLAKMDEVLQDQIEHLADQLMTATCVETSVTIVCKGDNIQSVVRTHGDKGSAEGLMEAVKAVIIVAGAALTRATGGEFELMIKSPKGIEPAVPKGTPTTMISRTRR